MTNDGIRQTSWPSARALRPVGRGEEHDFAAAGAGAEHLLYRVGDDWKPVAAASEYAAKRDTFNQVSFDPFETSALRLEVQLQSDFSGGILEWTVR